MQRFISSLIRRLSGQKRSLHQESNAQKDQLSIKVADPLDPLVKERGWKAAPPTPFQRNIRDFVKFAESQEARANVGDAAITTTAVMDESTELDSGGMTNPYSVPEVLQNWYMSQSFIGYQACAIIAQHWLIDKACSMAGEDAIRNGWELNALGDKAKLDKQHYDALRAYDVAFNVKANLAELDRFRNVFGIRIAIFHVESDDPKYYEKPFNPDGVTKGSYKGISQIDPYWMMPMMTAESTADPANIHFYDPEFWVISGKKYHRSHLIIARGPIPADVLKPTYIFGGIPLTQRIYERVYAAERTANEAPLLALNKRTTALHVDVDKAITNQSKFEERLMFWVKYRDNHAVKVLGKEEVMEQFDTSLADFDSVIMNQYQLVAAIAKTPATKLLGTSPKGFNATGEFESASYHEELESIQEHVMAPMLERHYLILGKSLGIDVKVQVVFEPVDSVTAMQRAELNSKIAETNEKNINMGAISPEEVRQCLRDDKYSGYNRLSDEDAEDQPGMSPDNLAALQKAGSEEQKGEASLQSAQAKQTIATKKPGEEDDASGAANPRPTGEPPVAPNTPNPALQLQEPGIVDPAAPSLASTLKVLGERLLKIEEALVPNNADLPHETTPALTRVMPTVAQTVKPTVAGIGSAVPQMDPIKHPKMKVNGILLGIENPRGTVRQGMDIDGKVWRVNMPHHYGYVKGVSGADGDELDCFVGPNLQSDKVFVINQKDQSGEFDEHKCMIGFDSPEEAKEAYHAAYATDWEGFDGMAEMTMDEFKSWIKSVDGCTTPLQSNCIGNTKSSVIDKADFKENEHPRAKNGQFGSGGSGGASSSEKSSASASPKSKPGSKKDALPALAKSMTEKNGKAPTPSEFHEAAIAAGFEIIPAQSVKYLKMYLKEQKDGGAKQKAKPEEKEAPKEKEQKTTIEVNHKEHSADYAGALGYPSPAAFASEKAQSAGYKTEGTYNGINYFKAPNGDKVSYKPDTDTWAAISGGKLIAQGAGIKSLDMHLVANKAQPAAPNTMASAPVSVSHHTATAKSYGDKIPEDKFKFASSGIANETALPQKVKESITAYKGSSYHDINNAMRFSDSFDPDKVSAKTMAHILNLQRAFSQVAPSTKDVTVGRKIQMEGLKAMAKDAGLGSLNDLKPGMILREPGIMSTSHNPHVWSGDVRFEIKLPKGSKAIDISETVKLNQSENEVLLGPDSKLKIHEVNQNHNAHGKEYKYHIVCELIQ